MQTDILITEAEACAEIGCPRRKIREWIYEGELWAINISTNPSPESDSGRRYRVSKTSALKMQQECKRGAGSWEGGKRLKSG